MRDLEKIVRDAMAANKCKVGFKEVLNSIRGSKLIVLSNTVESNAKSQMVKEANSSEIPILEFGGNSVALGRICNRPFRVSAIALKLGDDEEIQQLILNSKGPPNR
jgi:large subunit ribosomal protein L30e